MATTNGFVPSMPSPTEMMDTSAPNPYFASNHYNDQHANTNQQPPSFTANPFTPFAPTPNASIPTTPGSVAGRKRSRGETLTEDDIEPDGSLPTPASESGKMPRTESSWSEDNTARPFAVDHLRRPSMSSRKSQRKDVSSSGGSNDLAQLVLPANMREVTTEPLVDEVTRKLGISWSRMDASEARQINQAAYSKFIANHYPALKDVKVWFENAALPGYLVQATNVYSGESEFYLFSNDLTEARLVTRDASQLIPRLQMLPALHLAAPGGQIKAEMSPINLTQNEVSGYVKKEAETTGILQGCMQDHVFQKDYETVHREPVGICAAHSMEMD